MAEMPDGQFDLIFTSPPYNLGESSGGGFPDGKQSGKWSGGNLQNGYSSYSDDMPYEDYRVWQKSCLREMWRLLTPDGAIFYNHKPRVQNGVLQTPLDLNPDLPVRQIIIWKRDGGINFSPTFYLPSHEWIVIFAKPDFRLRSKAASGAKDVWEVSQERNNPHPAPFPVELPRIALQTVNARRVLDPFCGSGTTGVACREKDIDFTGIEIDPRYVEMAQRRIEDTAVNDDFFSNF
jgi:modification methylase